MKVLIQWIDGTTCEYTFKNQKNFHSFMKEMSDYVEYFEHIKERENKMKEYNYIPMAITYRNSNWDIISQYEFYYKSFDIENTSKFIDVSHKTDKYHRPDGTYEIIYCQDTMEIPKHFKEE